MTYIEFGTFVLLAVITTVGVWRQTQRQRRADLEAGRDPRSGTFAYAAASTLLAMKIDPLVRSGSTIYMPVGDGLYMLRTNSAKARAWRHVLRDWLRRGATIKVIVTVPSKSARYAWQPLERAASQRLEFIELHRQRASPEVALEIERLDTYHPVLLVNPEGLDGAPGAMWIEQYHPVGSAHAYAIDYVAPPEARSDPRFAQFLALYRQLLVGDHVHTGTTPQVEAPEAAPAKAA